MCVLQRLRSGSTGVAVLIQDQELTVAWLGDSQAILVRDGHVVRLMDPHKPEREVRIPHTNTQPLLPQISYYVVFQNGNADEIFEKFIS